MRLAAPDSPTPSSTVVVPQRGARRLQPLNLLLLGIAVLLARPELALALDGAWSTVTPGGVVPPVRRDVGAIYDPLRDRIVMLAGDGFTYAMNFDGPVWSRLSAAHLSGSPGFERAVYDAVNDRMIVVNSAMSVFALSLADSANWQNVTPVGTRPTPRTYFAVAKDKLRNRLLLFGGGPTAGNFNDVWALALTEPVVWSQIAPAGVGPPPTWGAVAAIDELHDRLIVSMGSSSGGYEVSSLSWSVNLSGIPQWASTGATGTPPVAGMLGSAMYDPADAAILFFGGYLNPNVTTFALRTDPAYSWTPIAPTGSAPSQRWSGNTMYRDVSSDLIVFGGFNGTTALNDIHLLSRAMPPGPPSLLQVDPFGGRVGDQVSLYGARLNTVTEVSFNGVPATLGFHDYQHVVTHVPAGATTGPITVTNPLGSASIAFFVGERPEITSAEPDSARPGATVLLRGRHFNGATRVRFGGTGGANFTVSSDSTILATVDSGASSGEISVTTPAATGSSSFHFVRLADNPHPLLYFVRDVRGDQGGKVLLSWQASDLDQSGRRTISGYRVWRRGQPPVGTSPVATLPSGWMARPAEGTGAQSLPVEYWEAIATLPAAFLRGYAYTAQTPADSTEGDPAWTAFFVQALTSDLYTFYNSVVDSGYSVDNLAPPTPTPFAVTYAPGGNTLHWRGRALADLRGYQVHRGTGPAFTPSASTLVVTTTDTTYSDVAGGHYYKLAAIDVHGNLSRFVSASPSQPVATLASFVNASRERDRIALTWYSGGNPGLEANVYRRTADSDWQLLRAILADGDGYLRFEDGEVADDVRYGYRLGIVEPDAGETLLGETWVDPVRTQFAMTGTGANPSRDGRVSLSFALPAASSARVQLFDIAGREVESHQLAGAAGSSPRIEFGSGARLRAGVYLVRATSGATTLTRRVVVLD